MMSVTSIEAACRRCEQRFFLNELLLVRSGVCPRCGWRLTEDWVGALLDAVVRAESSQRQLVLALRRINGLPGNIVPLPHQIVRNLIEDVGWQAELAQAEGLFVADREALTRLQQTWASPSADPSASQRTWWSRLWDGLRGAKRPPEQKPGRAQERPEALAPANTDARSAGGARLEPTASGTMPQERPTPLVSTSTTSGQRERERVASGPEPAVHLP
jgi:RNA polymerase subunit RPABC4/transcription elongation factor Spt4